jgi:hypothetical protein
MTEPATSSRSRFQVSLWQFLLWMTAISIVCALAQGLMSHLRYVETKEGSIPAEVVGRSLFYGFLIAAAFVGLMIGPPLCYTVAIVKSWRRKTDRA